MSLIEERLHEIDPREATLGFINDVLDCIGRPTLAEIPDATGPLASQTRLANAFGCSVFRLRQPETRPIAITKDAEMFKAFLLCGMLRTNFSGYPTFRPNGPLLYEVTLPNFTWEFCTGLPRELSLAS